MIDRRRTHQLYFTNKQFKVMNKILKGYKFKNYAEQRVIDEILLKLNPIENVACVYCGSKVLQVKKGICYNDFQALYHRYRHRLLTEKDKKVLAKIDFTRGWKKPLSLKEIKEYNQGRCDYNKTRYTPRKRRKKLK